MVAGAARVYTPHKEIPRSRGWGARPSLCLCCARASETLKISDETNGNASRRAPTKIEVQRAIFERYSPFAPCQDEGHIPIACRYVRVANPRLRRSIFGRGGVEGVQFPSVVVFSMPTRDGSLDRELSGHNKTSV